MSSPLGLSLAWTSLTGVVFSAILCRGRFAVQRCAGVVYPSPVSAGLPSDMSHDVASVDDLADDPTAESDVAGASVEMDGIGFGGAMVFGPVPESGLSVVSFEALLCNMCAELAHLIAQASVFRASMPDGPGRQRVRQFVHEASAARRAFELIIDLHFDSNLERRRVLLSAQRRFEAFQDAFVALRHAAPGMTAPAAN